MLIPSSQQWLNDTALGILRPRSAQMKAIDEAIKRYEQAKTQENLWRIKNALEDWKRGKGPAWTASDRNRGGAITRLDQQLMTVDPRLFQLTGARFTMEELKALAYMASERKKVIAKLFEGKEVTFRNSPQGIKQAAMDAGETVKRKCEEAESWLKGTGKKSVLSPADKAKQKLEEMAKSFFSVDTLDSLGGLTSLIVNIIEKCGVSVAPVVGHIKDGYDLFTGWAKAGAKLHEQYSISQCRYAIDTGIPAAAFSGLKACLVEETKKEAASAGIATTSFALKTGLFFADGGAISGPVVGAANAFAALSLQLYTLAAEYKATKGINEALRAGAARYPAVQHLSAHGLLHADERDVQRSDPHRQLRHARLDGLCGGPEEAEFRWNLRGVEQLDRQLAMGDQGAAEAPGEGRRPPNGHVLRSEGFWLQRQRHF